MVNNDPSMKSGLGQVGQGFVEMGRALKGKIETKWGQFTQKLPSKQDVKNKFTKENMGKVGEGLKNGSIKVLKKTAGAFLVGLSMITPKKTSDKLAPKGMELMTDSTVGKGYGAYKREKVGQQAKKMLGKAMQGLGKGLEKIGHKIAMHEKVDFNSKIYKAARFIEAKGTSAKFSGEQKIREGESGLQRVKERRPEPQESRTETRTTPTSTRPREPSDQEIGVLGAILGEIESESDEHVTGSHTGTTSVVNTDSQVEEHETPTGSHVGTTSVENPSSGTQGTNPLLDGIRGANLRHVPDTEKRDRSAPNLHLPSEENTDQDESPPIPPSRTETPSSTDTTSGPQGRGALLDDLKKEHKLKKAKTNDRSAPQLDDKSKTKTPPKTGEPETLQDMLRQNKRFQALGDNLESSGKDEPKVKDDDDW